MQNYIQGSEIRQPIGYNYYQTVKALAAGQTVADENNFFRKALTSGTSASGSEFIPSPTSAKIITHVFERSWARQIFPTWMMTSLTEAIPKFAGTCELDYISSENTTALGSATAITEGTIATTSRTLTLKTLAANIQLQNKWLAYNVSPQAEALVREHLLNRIREVEEDCFLNGDTDTSSANINYSYNATDHPHGYDSTHNEWLVMFDGLRNSATGTIVDAGSDAFTDADILSAIENLGKYGTDPNKVLIIVSTDIRTTMLGWTILQKLNEYGPGATVLSGEIGKVYGSSVVVTNKLPNKQDDTLTNTAGIRSASTATNSYSEALVVYTDSPIIGVPSAPERQLNIVRKAYEEFDRVHLFAIEDIAFAVAYPDAIVRIYDVLV